MPKRFSRSGASACVAPCATTINRGTLEISGANLMYEGARVKSWMLGRDVNPAGRGDGAYYAQGAFSIGSVRPSPTTTPVGGWGNSVNNGCGGGCGPRFGPPVGPWNDPPVLPPTIPKDFPIRPSDAKPNKETYAVLCTNACFPNSRMWDYAKGTRRYVPQKCGCCG